MIMYPKQFLSTPSGWRATILADESKRLTIFLSTPSGWRATTTRVAALENMIKFLSTPSGWRATVNRPDWFHDSGISIHALRVEGDLSHPIMMQLRVSYFYPRPPGGGRHARCFQLVKINYFYPRPPGGGRPVRRRKTVEAVKISIHALRVEGDRKEGSPMKTK